MDISELTLRLYLELMRDPVDGVPLVQVDEALFASELSPEKRARVLAIHHAQLSRAGRLAGDLTAKLAQPATATQATIQPKQSASALKK